MQAGRSALLARITDLIYPPECAGCRELTDAAHGLCPACWRETRFISGAACDCCGQPVATPAPDAISRCETCSTHPPAWSRGRAAVLYEGKARDVLLKFKHRDRLDLAPTLAGWMARAGADLLAEADLIAPVPLHWTRLIMRRTNQAAELARQQALARHAPVVADLLLRRHRTPRLKGKDRAERRRLLAGAIGIAPHQTARVKGRRILLVDDVMTTGATLSACADALITAGAADVTVLVVARVARAEFPSI